MRLDGQYDARADIAWLRFADYDAAVAVDEEGENDLLREFDRPTGRTVGLAVRHARTRLPQEFLKMLEQQAPREDDGPPAEAPRRGRHSGLEHHRRLEQLHDAWG